MHSYNFVSLWTVEAPLPLVWKTIKTASEWPQWWKALKKVQIIENGDPSGVGEITESTLRTALPYTLSFRFEVTEVIEHQKIAGRAFGELEGTGIWSFTEHEGITTVRYDWQVRTTKAWMNALAPLLKPAFHWNHSVVMGWGEEGLRRRCGALAATVQLGVV